MTEDNRSRNAADELDRAEFCLKEAQTLMASGMPYGTASRAYYAVFTAHVHCCSPQGSSPEVTGASLH